MARKYSILYYLKSGIYFFLYGCVKYFPTPVGDVLRAWVLKLFMKKIGTYYVRDGATFLFPENISIDKGTCINEWVWMDASGGIEIGKNVLIAPSVHIISFDHGITKREDLIIDQSKDLGKIMIEDDVWIGAGSKILKGVTIGKGAVIGAASVVTKNIPSYAVVAGVPAKTISER